MHASFAPVDLAAVTTELASVFRAAIERAGLSFAVRCEPLPEPVYVDREMWEEIVLTLLSNAFKFTFEGAIEVVQRAMDDSARHGNRRGARRAAAAVRTIPPRRRREGTHARRFRHRPLARSRARAHARRRDPG
jgi:signal transduction histidine kinase